MVATPLTIIHYNPIAREAPMGLPRGNWIKLHVSANKLGKVLGHIGCDSHYEKYFITDFEAPFANLDISEYLNIEELNDFAARRKALAEWDTTKLCAVLEMESHMGIAGILNIIDDYEAYGRDIQMECSGCICLGSAGKTLCCPRFFLSTIFRCCQIIDGRVEK